MSISWAITDKRFERQPWRRENFDGYFTDIRRAARKSLPRRPNKDLCGLLGIPLSPGRLKPVGAGTAEHSIAESLTNAPVALKPVPNHTADSPPDGAVQGKGSNFDKLKAALLCNTSRTENCSRREKTVLGFSVYFAIIIFILLIIVLILSTTLSRLNENNDSESGKVQNTNVRTTTNADTSSPSSSSKPTSVPISSSEISSVSYPSGNDSKTVTTTTESISVTRTTSPSSNISITSRSTSGSISSGTSVSTSGTRSTKSVITKIKSTLSPTTKLPIANVSFVSASTSVSATTTENTNTSFENITSSSTSSVSSTTGSTSEPTLSPTTLKITADPVLFPVLQQQKFNCSSSECSAANKTLGRVDSGTSPCVDFYEFSCGSWLQEQKHKEQEGDVKNIPQSIQAELRQNLLYDIKGLLQKPYREDESVPVKISKRLFQSCKESNEQSDQNFTEMQEIHAFLEHLGMAADGNILNSFDEVLRIAVTRFEVTPFFQMSTETILDKNRINVFALKLEPPTMYLDYTIYNQPVSKGEESLRYVEKLTQLMYSYISSFGSRRKRQASGGSANTTVEYGEIFNKVLRMYYVESNISKILENTTSTSHLQYATFSYTYSNLTDVYPSINWDAATGLSRDVPIQLVNADYFHSLNNIWSTLDEDAMKYFVFMSVFVRRALTYTSLPVRSVLGGIGGNGDMVHTDIDCVELSLNLAREEIHATYIGQFTQEVLSNRLTLTNIKNKITNAFQKYLSSSSWIQPDIERAVSALARNIKMHFSLLKSKVKQTANITGSSQSFLSLALELHRQKYSLEMERLGSKVTEILMDWTSSQIYFDANFNAIGLPTGLTVYLSDDDPPFDLYGYIGMMMAEEITKVLTGSLTGGVPPQWWGTTNILAFNDVTQCFSGQLSMLQNNYYDIGNVIILNGAFQVIDQVYFTDSPNTDRAIEGTSVNENMIFIINIAQLHCQLNDGSQRYSLRKERINNAMMNNVNFKRMFSCPDTSPMVSENTCSLFL